MGAIEEAKGSYNKCIEIVKLKSPKNIILLT
jgi:hypothetical protein